MTFDQYLAAYVLKHILWSDLPSVAVQGLLEGNDSLALGALAGSTPRLLSPLEMEGMLKEGLRDIDRQLPDRWTAAQTLKRLFASQVASGIVSASEGAAKIVALATDMETDYPSREYVGDNLRVSKLLGLYYSYDEVGYDNAEIDRAIRVECVRIADGDAV